MGRLLHVLVLALAACSAVAQPRVYVLCVGEAGQGWVDKYAFTRAFTYEERAPAPRPAGSGAWSCRPHLMSL